MRMGARCQGFGHQYVMVSKQIGQKTLCIQQCLLCDVCEVWFRDFSNHDKLSTAFE